MALSQEMRRLQNKWHTAAGWPKRLEALEITGLRGWTNQRVEFGFPIVAIVGENGSGKSTITTVLVAAATRYCSAHAMFMMHPTTVGPFGVPVGADRLQSALDSAVADDERTERIMRERTKLPDEVLKKKRLGDVHLSPKEALQFGLVHEIREFAVPRGNQLVQI